jgi:hypothetical protein
MAERRNGGTAELAEQLILAEWRNAPFNLLLGACRNSFFCLFGIFLAKKSSQSSKFQQGNVLHGHFLVIL